MKVVVLPLLVLLMFASGCVNEVTDENMALEKCRELCESSDLDLDASPCLSNDVAKDWVCDVAHSPRQEIDNQPENQCEAYRNGTAHHFVELDADCELIKMQ